MERTTGTFIKGALKLN